ncbi:MAG: hypothetical protein GY765_29275 [bacterium]|nr:hypothetical protein [bacterium]
MNKQIAITILILTLTVLPCTADTFTHNEAGMSIWFPDDWKTAVEGDMLEAVAPDEDAYIQLLAINDVETLDEAVDAYTEEIDKLVNDFKTVGEGENIDINGLAVFYVDGEGKVEGVPMDISIALVVTDKAIVMVLAFSAKESTAKYEKDFDQIVASIKAI